MRVLLGGIEQGLHALAVAAAVGGIRGGEVQVEAQPVLRAPGVRGQRVEAAVEIVEGRPRRRRILARSPAHRLKGGERDAFVGVVDGAAREVEVAGDLEHPAVSAPGVEVLAQQATDAQMELLARRPRAAR